MRRIPARAAALESAETGLITPPDAEGKSDYALPVVAQPGTAPKILPEADPPDAMDGHDVSFSEPRGTDRDPQR